jgi:hypothetical protein
MAGQKVLAGLSEELASAVFQGNERDVLEFDLCLVGLQVLLLLLVLSTVLLLPLILLLLLQSLLLLLLLL